MIFDIDHIMQEGLEFDLTMAWDQFKIDLVDCNLKNDVRIQGNLNRLNQDIFLKGCVETGLQIICSRCLEPIDFSIHTKLFTRFIPRGTVDDLRPEYEIRKSNIETEYYSANRVDISRSVYDAILLNVPMVGLCGNDCLGLCDLCGKNLNHGPCQCSRKDEIDPRLHVLKKIKTYKMN